MFSELDRPILERLRKALTRYLGHHVDHDDLGTAIGEIFYLLELLDPAPLEHRIKMLEAQVEALRNGGVQTELNKLSTALFYLGGKLDNWQDEGDRGGQPAVVEDDTWVAFRSDVSSMRRLAKEARVALHQAQELLK